MCGICGYLSLRPELDYRVLRAMNDALAHRGPDGGTQRSFSSPPDNDSQRHYFCGLAMRRLSIIDIEGSEQPLYNEDETISVVFNGEIYNFRELRSDLEARGHRFKTQGDGETIVHLYEEYGEDAPQHLRGMFAFALFDAKQQRLLLARDRLGKKPLYYYRSGVDLVFASEIKALLMHPAVPRRAIFENNRRMLALYLGYGYIPEPLTAFERIFALPAGHTLSVPADAPQQGEPRAYWTPPAQAAADPRARMQDYVEPLRATLEEAVRLRLIADVPLGAFLSGGLDSSLVVAYMQRLSSAPVKTFSIGFAGGAGFDETPYAAQVAQHLGTEHTVFTVQPDAMGLLPRLVWHYDQPFADSSAIPTYLVSALTRQHVTVALTGDGGDELFGGYERFAGAGLLRRLQPVPDRLWRGLGDALTLLPQGTGYYNPVKRAQRFVQAALLPLERAYFDWVRLFDAAGIRAVCGESDIAGDHFAALFNGQPVDVARILEINLTSYLRDDLLVKADRCSMMASLEARSPLLDHVLLEQAARIPLNLKIQGMQTKRILKEAARGLLPDAIIDRRKHGFGAPLGAWLREDLGAARELLSSRQTRSRALFDTAGVLDLLDEHASGKRDHGYRIWTLLTLETWHRLFIDPATLSAPPIPEGLLQSV